MVTHPFHPLAGRRLVVLVAKRRAGAVVFVCASCASRSVTLPREGPTARRVLPRTGSRPRA
ncbi:DUF5372 family protein [Streptomyces avermitilis]